jgi:uncharacterized protein involved in exopolysaccharide biosynthesis
MEALLNESSSFPVRVSGATPVLVESEEALPEYLPAGISLAQVLAIVRARWRVTAVVALSLLVILVGILKLVPRTYTATATLMVSYELNQGGKEFPIGAVGTYMGTQVEFITSDRVLLPVIKALNLTEDREFTAGFSGDEATERDAWVLKELRDKLTVTQGRGSQLLYVQAGVREPQKAARIANAIVDTYLREERRLASEPATQRATEYAKQLEELQAKVTAARENVTAYRRRSGLSDIAPREGADPQALETLEQQLLNQGAQLAQLRATLGPRHPRILELKSQMSETRAALARQIGVYGDVKQQRDDGAKLLLQLDSAEAVYNRALDGYDEIMFASDGKRTNVSLISRAVPSVTPTKPPILKYLLAGTLLAMLVGVLAPLMHEVWLDRRIRCRDDLERHFGMPVLAELGHRDGWTRRS